MVPGNPGVTGNQGCSHNSPARAAVLEGKHGKNTAEDKIDIEKKCKFEVITRESGDDQKDKRRNSAQIFGNKSTHR